MDTSRRGSCCMPQRDERFEVFAYVVTRGNVELARAILVAAVV